MYLVESATDLQLGVMPTLTTGGALLIGRDILEQLFHRGYHIGL